MQGKQTVRRLLGMIAIVLGALLAARACWYLTLSAAYSLQGYRIDLWYLPAQLWFLALGTYFISVGLRKCRASGTGEERKKQRVLWGRVLIGLFLIIATITNRIHPTHSRWELKPDNETQAAAMKATQTFLTYFLPVLGALLMFAGVQARFKKPAQRTVDLESDATNAQIPPASQPQDK